MKHIASADVVIVAIVALVAVVWYSILEDNKYLVELKSGEKTLECVLADGPEIIPPSKIVNVDMDTHTFIFTNGSATNCEVITTTTTKDVR